MLSQAECGTHESAAATPPRHYLTPTSSTQPVSTRAWLRSLRLQDTTVSCVCGRLTEATLTEKYNRTAYFRFCSQNQPRIFLSASGRAGRPLKLHQLHHLRRGGAAPLQWRQCRCDSRLVSRRARRRKRSQCDVSRTRRRRTNGGRGSARDEHQPPAAASERSTFDCALS